MGFSDLSSIKSGWVPRTAAHIQQKMKDGMVDMGSSEEQAFVNGG